MPFSVPMTTLPGSGGQQGLVWRGLEVLANNINNRGKTLNSTRKIAMGRVAAEMLAYAKENAPWEDRTTDARELLQSAVVHDDGKQTSTAYLAHGVEYGIYLETAAGGEYAIIMPTILAFRRQLMGTVKEVDSIQSILASAASRKA